MKYISNIPDLITNIPNNFDLAAIIAAIISISASVYIFKATPKYELVYNRYTSLIFPLFQLIEPYLFKTMNKKVLSNAVDLIEQNKMFAGNQLIYISYICKKNPCQENFDFLCSYVSKEYDRCCTRLGLGKRSISYKVSKGQYKNKIMLIVYAIWESFIYLVILISFVFLMFYLAKLLKDSTGIEIIPLTK